MDDPSPPDTTILQPELRESEARPASPSTLSEFVAASGGKSARAFLRKMKKGAFSIPSSNEIVAMAQKAVSRPLGAHRVLILLEAIDEANASLRESILALGEEYLRQCNVVSSSQPPRSPAECRSVAGHLLRPSSPKVRKPKSDIFAIFIHVAFHRGWMGEEDVFESLERAFPPPKIRRVAAGGAKADESVSASAIILGTPFKKPNLPPLLALHRTWKKRTATTAEHIKQLQAAVSRLEAENKEVATAFEQANLEISKLKDEVGLKTQRVEDLEQEITDARTRAQHRYDVLKGHLRGFLAGELARWLQNAAEAASIEPPRLRVIQERLQSAISGTQKEITWLESSD